MIKKKNLPASLTEVGEEVADLLTVSTSSTIGVGVGVSVVATAGAPVLKFSEIVGLISSTFEFEFIFDVSFYY